MWFYVQMWLPVWTVALTAAICFSVASFIMRRSVKPHQPIISAPVQGVMTGTVASVSRGPSEDRSSGLVSTGRGFYIGRRSWRLLAGVTKIRDPSRAGHVVCRTDFWFSL